MATHRSSHSRVQPDAVERLYVYWITSVLILVLVIILLAFFTGAVYRQNRALAARVAALEEQHVANPTTQPAPVRPTPPTPSANDNTAATQPPANNRQPPAPPPNATVPAANGRYATAPVVPPAGPTAPAESTITAELDRVLVPHPWVGRTLRDAADARSLLDTAIASLDIAGWAAQTWERLALVARLLNDDQLTARLSRRAQSAGSQLAALCELDVRMRLATNPVTALPAARDLSERTGAAPAAQVLLAAALLAANQPAEADVIVADLPDGDALVAADRLRLARVALELERWALLRQLMETLGPISPALKPEHDYLYAAALAHVGQTVEALGILDFLADPANRPADPLLPVPTAAEVETERGVTLTAAHQFEAARTAFDTAAAAAPDHPAVYYQRAVLEAIAGNADTAREYLRNALALDAEYAPAWETLAALDLNANRVQDALTALEQAIRANPRRPLAHFSLAVARAKLSQRNEAATALREAFRLDPALLETAKQTEVLTRLFTPADLTALATGAELAPTPAAAP